MCSERPSVVSVVSQQVSSAFLHKLLSTCVLLIAVDCLHLEEFMGLGDTVAVMRDSCEREREREFVTRMGIQAGELGGAGRWAKQGISYLIEVLCDANLDGRILLLAVLSVIIFACRRLCASAADGSFNFRTLRSKQNRSSISASWLGIGAEIGELVHRRLAELAMFIFKETSAMALRFGQTSGAFSSQPSLNQQQSAPESASESVQQQLLERAIRLAADGDYDQRSLTRIAPIRLVAPAADDEKPHLPEVEVMLEGDTVVVRSHSQGASLNGSVTAGDFTSGSEEANRFGAAMAREASELQWCASHLLPTPLVTQRIHRPCENRVPRLPSSVQKFDHDEQRARSSLQGSRHGFSLIVKSWVDIGALALFGRATRFALDGDNYWRSLTRIGPLRLFAPTDIEEPRLAEVEVTLEGDASLATVVVRPQSQRVSLNGSVIAGYVQLAQCYPDFTSPGSEEANQLGAMTREAFELRGAAHLPTQKIHQPWEKLSPRVPLIVQKFVFDEQRERETDFGAVLLGATRDKKLADKDTNAALLGLLIKGRDFLRASCVHLSARAQSLLSYLYNLLTDIRRGSSHLTPTNLVQGDMQLATNKQILFFCSISFNLLSHAHAQDHTENGKPERSDYVKVAAMTLLASSIGGVGVIVWILYNRRKTFSDDDIDEGLMNGPAVVRRDDPNFALPPPIVESWSDEE